jgi:class 3 adenylate cyclase/tetratricopeptide (TPR) repeat protein
MGNHGDVCPQCHGALPAGARFCPHCGARAGQEVAPAASASAPPGERRQVAVLFADLSGYTRLSSTLDAEEVHRMLTRYFELADSAIERMGGAIDKHLGDAVMGVFGAPIAHGNDIERALRAAVDIHAAMATLSREFARPLAAHIGVASGEVVAAATGSAAHRTYTVTGDAVNLAARLTELAHAGETAISDNVRRAVGSLADVESVDAVAIRGLEGDVRVWKLRGLREQGAARQPLVGRDRERRRFAELLAQAATTRIGSVGLICADPGMGKTRLADAFLATALAEGAFCHSAVVLDFGAGQGQDAVYALVCSLLDVPPGAGAATRRETLERAIAQARASAENETYIADLLAIPQRSGSVYEAMDNEARQRGKLQALSDIVERAAARAPCVLLVEDIHWASSWVLACLHEIAACATRGPVLLLMTTRREDDAQSASWPVDGVTRFDLAPLDPADALSLARIHFATSPDLAQRCVDRAQGNPLFLVQLLRSDTDDPSIPATIQSVVLARLDRLSPRDKAAVQAASIIGQRFEIELLRHLIHDVSYDPAVPIARDLVRLETAGAGRVMFTHALIRDGAYASLLHSSRRELHRAAASWYENRDPTLRAEHLDRAEDPRAAEAYLDAARAEHAALRIDAALGLAECGGELKATGRIGHALAILTGKLHRELGHAPLALASFERARDLASDDRERCVAWIGIASVHRLTSDLASGLTALDAAAPLAAHPGLEREAAQIHYLRGALYFAMGDVDACRTEHELALEFAQRSADPEREAQALSGLADALYAQGRMKSAHAAFARCVEICDRAGLRRFAIQNGLMLAVIESYFGQVDTSLARIAHARDAARELQHRVAEAMADECAGWILTALGRYGEARAPIERGLKLSREIGMRRFEAACLPNLARVLWSEGAKDAARRTARDAWTLCEQFSPRFAGPQALGTIAIIAESDDERSWALATAEQLLAQGCVGHCHLEFYAAAIDVMLGQRNWSEAERYADALEAYAKPEPLPWSEFYAARGRALAAAGRGAPDRVALERCRRGGIELNFAAAVPALDEALAALR